MHKVAPGAAWRLGHHKYEQTDEGQGRRDRANRQPGDYATTVRVPIMKPLVAIGPPQPFGSAPQGSMHCQV